MLSFSCDASYAACAQFDAAYNVSDTSEEVAKLTIAPPTDMSDEEADDFSTLLPSPLLYFNNNTQ
jgi:hypothetical protein